MAFSNNLQVFTDDVTALFTRIEGNLPSIREFDPLAGTSNLNDPSSLWHDDTAAFDAAKAAGYPAVLFPYIGPDNFYYGNFLIDQDFGMLAVPGTPGARVLVLPKTTDPVVTIDASSHLNYVAIKGFLFRNQFGGSFVNTDAIYITGASCNFMEIENVWTQNVRHAIYNDQVEIEHLYVRHNRWLTSKSDDVMFDIGSSQQSSIVLWEDCASGGSAGNVWHYTLNNTSPGFKTANHKWLMCDPEGAAGAAVLVDGPGGFENWSFDTFYTESCCQSSSGVTPHDGVFVFANSLGGSASFDNMRMFGDPNTRNPDYGIYDGTSAGLGLYNIRGTTFRDTNTKDIFSATGFVDLGSNVYSNSADLRSTTVTVKTGSFVPSVAIGGASTGITYVNQVGDYRIIDKQCFFKVFIHLLSKGSLSGAVTIEGLPFASRNKALSITNIDVELNVFTSQGDAYKDDVQGYVDRNVDNIILVYKQVSGGVITQNQITNAWLDNDSRIQISGVYELP